MCDNKEVISGYVSKIRYYNEQNHFIIFRLEMDDGDDITCTGYTINVNAGDNLKLTGKYVEHIKYGIQFSFETVEKKSPETATEIEQYLSSGIIKGIGPKTAAKIVDKFGEDSLDIIKNNPEKLSSIKGITFQKALDISSSLQVTDPIERVLLTLFKYGISNKNALKLYEHYGEEILGIIEDNPYSIIKDINNISFKDIDRLALRSGFNNNSKERIESAIVYILQQYLYAGSTYLPVEVLQVKLNKFLNLNIDDIDFYLEDMLLNQSISIKIMNDTKCVFLYYVYTTQNNLANLLIMHNKQLDIDCDELDINIKQIETKSEITLDTKQVQAIKEAFLNNIFILTGGPGTGKTTTVNSMIKLFELEGMDIELAAPTGRAARKLASMCNRKANTIHKLLEVSSVDDTDISKTYFARNEDNPLECDVLIIDEVSMVDIFLMQAIMKALTDDTRLILIGDTNQLPSVGPGSILKDIVESNIFNVVMLDKIFRQASKSSIVTNAHRIIKKQGLLVENEGDLSFIESNSEQDVVNKIKGLITKDLPCKFNVDKFDIALITPTKKGELGSVLLNSNLQKYINPKSYDKEEYIYGTKTFRVGDKVMQIRNNYEIKWQIYDEDGYVNEEGSSLFNGDIGRILEIDKLTQTLHIIFDGDREVDYSFDNLDDLELAYAITVHKSQGSEYDIVVIPILSGPPILFYNNLLYTAITRAKRQVVIIGSNDKINQMINNTNQQKRWTGLDIFLNDKKDIVF